ncbi:MAG: hypothetical protein IPH07_16210 [Deltaproteobacteria bacterium]|nr:hypothetical protein [Deltaproteobacteria bacterium]MBK8239318.1 hypothetical protein [Deltaproteobacteria bacterium]MBK8719604.1 hypothetical protein [Deltaproteobacteria bacterium]MBP7290894.1 hypothetical protein [Nannocystaceae bacterium]
MIAEHVGVVHGQQRRALLAWPEQPRREALGNLLRSVGYEVVAHEVGSMAAHAARRRDGTAAAEVFIVLVARPYWLGLSVIESARLIAPALVILAVVEPEEGWVYEEAERLGADRIVPARFIRLTLRAVISSVPSVREGGLSCSTR